MNSLVIGISFKPPVWVHNPIITSKLPPIEAKSSSDISILITSPAGAYNPVIKLRFTNTSVGLIEIFLITACSLSSTSP